jgi:hypothetical protein
MIRIRIRQNDSNPDQAKLFESGSGKLNEYDYEERIGIRIGQWVPIWIQNFNTVLILPYMHKYVSTQHCRIFQRFTRLEKGS